MKKHACILGLIVSLTFAHKTMAAQDDDAFLKALQDTLAKLGNPWIAELPSVPYETRQKWTELGTTGLDLAKIGKTKNMQPKESAHASERRLRGEKPPASWDWRNVNGQNWMTPVKNQGICGSCWAFAACSATEAKIKIFENTPSVDPNLCEQYLVSCEDCQDAGGCGGGCNGGWYMEAFQWMIDYGIPDETCYPYTGGDGNCSDTCSDRTARARYAINYGMTPADSLSYKNEIMNGPAACAIEVKEDMFFYKSGVYTPIMGKTLNHAVCLCGWSNSQSAWLCKNSWGSSQSYLWISYGDEGGWSGPSYVSWIEPKPNTPYMSIVTIKIENDGNGDHILDPGENADIIIRLTNMGAVDASGVTAVLRVSATDVTVSDSTANYGDMAEGDSVENTGDVFHVSASSSAPIGARTATLHIEANGGAYKIDRTFNLWIGIERMVVADIKAGNSLLTTTPYASVGFGDYQQVSGKGFIYPANGIQTIYYGSMAFGNASNYVVDNWFGANGGQNKDWKTTNSPDGRLVWVSPPTKGDTMVYGMYSDSGLPAPKKIICEHEAWAFSEPGYDDFVILSYKYENKGASTITGLYSAIFCDFDVGNAVKNNSKTSAPKYLAWVDNDTTYAGITLLDPLTQLKNVSAVANSLYIWNGTTEDNKYKFMNNTLHFDQGQFGKHDYSALVSAGPFDLTPGGSQIVAFAIVGGNSKTAIEDNADSARAAYMRVGAEENEALNTKELILKDLVSNPITKTTTISFSLPTTSDVTIIVYDITGRMVQELRRGTFIAGTHTVEWDVSKMSSGVFFVKLDNGKATRVKKAIVF